MTENERIVKWNEERGLIKTLEDFNLGKEISFIIEECIEMVTDVNSEDARKMAENITGQIMKVSDGKLDIKRVVDGAGDIKVFAAGLIRKLGFDPDVVMDEVLTEIETRTGSIQNGKFVKDRSPEAMVKWATADFSKAEL